MGEVSWGTAMAASPIVLVATVIGGVIAFVIAVGCVMVRNGAKGLAMAAGSAAVVVAGLVMVVGMLGSRGAHRATDAAAARPGLSPTQQARLREHGYAEAAYYWQFGAAVGVAPLLIGLVTIVRAARRRTA